MTSKQASGKPAFPVPISYAEPGINVRTYIATKVLAAIAQDTMNCGENPEYAANAAVKFADALLIELSKS